MSESSDAINFTIGPVQGFIAQARRTRDLWSGSFLLSYLSGCAMAEIRRQGGEILLPSVSKDDGSEDPLLKRIEGKSNGSQPRIGTLPNRFRAVAERPAVAASSAAERVRSEWKKIADCVWDIYVKGVAVDGNNTKDIWERQVNNFWEIHWAIGGQEGIEARKNWRFYADWEYSRPTTEGGDHCTIMSDWQELSGYVRARERREQDKFWSEMRRNTGGMDLREDERLCAIALIKRMFPFVAKNAIGWEVDADSWPSTLYVAAIPWLRSVIESDPEEANRYANMAMRFAKHIRREGVAEQIFKRKDPFLEMDANFYYTTSLKSPRSTPLDGTPEGGDEPEEVEKDREELIERLEKLYERNGSPSPFYAMLLMDGDNMGKLIRDKGEKVSSALASFSNGVDKIVQDSDGVLIYAGGDDVLAMLPLNRALSCACRISRKFEDAFNEKDIKATISAGVVFASYRVPLSSVMREAHSILEDIAKDDNGRGSIAVSVLKGSGRYCSWVSSWNGAVSSETGEVILERLAKSPDERRESRETSSSFIYKSRELMLKLTGWPRWTPGIFFNLGHLEGLDLEELLLAEHLNALRHRSEITEDVRARAGRYVRDLISVSLRNPGPEWKGGTGDEICADGMLLVKFLSQRGVSE